MPASYYILFLNKLRQIELFVKTQLLKVGRLLAFQIKRRIKLEKISFGYYKNWQFNNAYLFIDFKFKNAVGFRIGKYKSYDLSKQIVLDLKNIQAEKIQFVVFGYLQKQVYEISLKKEAEINTQSFKTIINNINTVVLVGKEIIPRIQKIGLHIPKLNSNIEAISVKQQNIQLCNRTFIIQYHI